MKNINRTIACISLCILALCTSCYHLSGNNRNLALIRVSHVQNTTAEPELGAMLHSAIAEQLSVAPRKKGIKPIYPLDLKILNIENSTLARAEIRDKKSRDDDSDAYQTVLYRIAIKVQYSLTISDDKTLDGTVTGIGDLPKMHDRNVPLQYALRLAANDAARKIVDAFNDSPLLQP